jgi:hypothetical protein
MCWKLIAKHVQTAIWVKPEDDSCRLKNADMKLLNICESNDKFSPSWKIPLMNCVRLNKDQSEMQRLPSRPDRLPFYSKSLEMTGQLHFFIPYSYRTKDKTPFAATNLSQVPL